MGKLFWVEHGRAGEPYSNRLCARDATALTRTLRALAGTSPTGCCGGRGLAEGCYDCGALVATTSSEDPALLFDFALIVLGWATPGDVSAPVQ